MSTRRNALTTYRRSACETLESRQLLAADTVLISEFMASNQDTLLDDFGESSDWIELHNPTAQPVDLAGWSLSDDGDELTKWIFPANTVLGANQYLLVWASGTDVRTPGQPLHADFKLSSKGEFLGLTNTDGQLVSSYGPDGIYPPQHQDVSYGIPTGGGDPQFFDNATPGTANTPGVLGFVADTRFSVDRGFYDSAFQLEIQSDTPGATLVYTVDGSTPGPDNGVRVQGGAQSGPLAAITVTGTTTVRAMAYRDGWTPTNVDTQTYLFLDQVIGQTGDGLPNTWGHAGADYQMDPEIVQDPQYQGQVIPGLLSLPTLSLVSDLDNWFGRRGKGIYPEGSGSPRPVSVEWLDPTATTDGEDQPEQTDFQVDGSVEIQGGSSTNRWKSDKLSMQLKFKRQYGDASLDYPLFGPDATDEFETLIVDARLNQAWHYGGRSGADTQRLRAQYARDNYMAALQMAVDGHAPHAKWVHVYLNGIYWGIHNLHERPDEHYAAAYFGGDADDYDVIKHNDDVVNGSLDNYQQLLRLVNGNVASDVRYRQVTDILEVDQFISYMLVNYYAGNVDWAHHNWYATYNHASGEGKWRFHSWDAEHVLRGRHDDVTGRDDSQGPTHIHHRLMRNPDYQFQFMDAVQRHFTGDGAFTPQQASALYQQQLDEVYAALVPESARWGDNQRRQPFTRDNEWVAERERLMETYFPGRTDTVLQQFRNQGWFPNFDAPTANAESGEVERGFALRLRSTRGDVYYTLDGSDPRNSASAVRYQQPLDIQQAQHIRARTRLSGQWSAQTELHLQIASPTLPGDFNGDQIVSSADVDLLAAAIREGSSDMRFDLNDDQRVDQRDHTRWLNEIAQTRQGDTNLDGQVGFADFLALSEHFGQQQASWDDGDFDGDGEVGFSDFLLLSQFFGWQRGG